MLTSALGWAVMRLTHMLRQSRCCRLYNTVQRLPPLFLSLFCIDLGHVLAEEKVDIWHDTCGHDNEHIPCCVCYHGLDEMQASACVSACFGLWQCKFQLVSVHALACVSARFSLCQQHDVVTKLHAPSDHSHSGSCIGRVTRQSLIHAFVHGTPFL